MQTKSIVHLIVVTLAMLLIPLVAMQFNSGFDWDLFDFIVAGILIFSAGFAYKIFSSKTKDIKKRLFIGILIAFVFVIVWAELAVGLFGTPFAGN